MSGFRIALVSREVYPFGGGGLGVYVTTTANVLAEIAEVTLVTMDTFEERYQELRRANSPLLPHPDVQVAFVRDPRAKEIGSFFTHAHLWSARVLERLKELYPDGGPELIEFPDYLGEGAVAAQARQTLDPWLRRTLVCVRLHTANEMGTVLNGYILRDPSVRVHFDLERYALFHADEILWAGGDILRTYEDFYKRRLSHAACVRHPVVAPTVDHTDSAPRSSSKELRFLYAGRFEHRKGVQNLLRAFSWLDRDDWRLTLVGSDTETGPLGTSVRRQLELSVANDPRVEFRDGQSRDEIFELMRDQDVLVSPSLWECWPTVVLEALSQNLPVFATPVGGHIELVQPGVSGWLAEDTDRDALTRSLERLLERRDEVEELAASGRPRRHFEQLTDVDGIKTAYSDLASKARSRSARPVPKPPLVSVVVPYFRLEDYVEQTVRSIFEQTYRRLEVIIVGDGSFRDEDWILGELASRYPVTVLVQDNSGLGAARNFGIRQSRGKYVFPLDADNMAAASFVERCVTVLEQRPEVAYVNAWVRYIDEHGRPHPPPTEGYQPFSNTGETLDTLNVAGDAAAVIRRHVFNLGFWYSIDAAPSYEDWLFYRDLAGAGFTGHAIPERLLLYRVRERSMLREVGHQHHERLVAELDAHERLRNVQWVS
jgi:glycogen(starch) synthase